MKKLLWSDNWWIEGNKAWYVAGEVNALFEVDLINNSSQLLSLLPVKKIYEFRAYPRCIKYLNKIFCIPDRGDSILIYFLTDKLWKKISLDNLNNVRIAMNNFWKIEEKLWCVANGLKQIIKINLDDERVEKIWNVDIEEGIEFSGSAMTENEICIVSATQPKIYVFEKDTEVIKVFNLNGLKKKLFSIVYDGEKFWITGFDKEIYIWYKEKNKLEILKQFPAKFGTYHVNGKEINKWNNREFIFLSLIYLNEWVFFISKYANQILCINKQTYAMNLIEIENEDETLEEVEAQLLSHKYLFEYIRENRFIGIYSLKNQEIFEIDTYEKKDIRLPFYLKKDTLKKLADLKLLDFINFVCKNKTFEEKNSDNLNDISYGKKLFLELKNI